MRVLGVCDVCGIGIVPVFDVCEMWVVVGFIPLMPMARDGGWVGG